MSRNFCKGNNAVLQFFYDIRENCLDLRKPCLYKDKPPEEYVISDNKHVRESIFALHIRKGFGGGVRLQETPTINYKYRADISDHRHITTRL